VRVYRTKAVAGLSFTSNNVSATFTVSANCTGSETIGSTICRFVTSLVLPGARAVSFLPFRLLRPPSRRQDLLETRQLRSISSSNTFANSLRFIRAPPWQSEDVCPDSERPFRARASFSRWLCGPALVRNKTI
jgi:hypothetical protein